MVSKKGALGQCCGSESGSGSTGSHVLGLLDPDPDLSVRGMDPDPDLDPSVTKQKTKKNFDSYCFATCFDFLSSKMMYMYLQKVPVIS
jgi:hypothetical protein